MIEQLLAIGAAQGALLFLLLFFDSRSVVASRYLGLLCLMASAALLGELLKANPSHWAFPLLCGLFYLPASGGLLAFLYCRAALSGKALSLRDAGLFAPLLLCLLLSVDIALQDPHAFATWVAGSRHSSWRPQASEYVLFLQAFGFAAATSLMIYRYRREAPDLLSSFLPTKFNLLLALQLFTIAIWVLNALPALTSAPLIFLHSANFMTVLVLYLIAIAQWRFPQLFLVEKLGAEAGELLAETQSRPAGEPAVPAQIAEDHFTKSLFSHIQSVVEEQELYRQSQLTLSELSEAVSLTRHQVSEAINRGSGKNFYEFINSYRVQAVLESLEAGYEGRLLDLGLEVGFSSKSTFNSVFKKATGMTPGEYRRSLEG